MDYSSVGEDRKFKEVRPMSFYQDSSGFITDLRIITDKNEKVIHVSYIWANEKRVYVETEETVTVTTFEKL